MAKITIAEKDLTSSGLTSVAENIVYVPGYAITGPVNTPTLCRSYSEFTSIFGKVPYRWKENQVMNSELIAYENDMEKSYLYAAELLKQGLSIMYERISVNDTQKANAVINFNDVRYTGNYTQDNITDWVLPETTITGTETKITNFEQTVTILNIYKAVPGTIKIKLPTTDIVLTDAPANNTKTVRATSTGVLYNGNTEVTNSSINYDTGEISFALPGVEALTKPVLSYTIGAQGEVAASEWQVVYHNVNNEMSCNITVDGNPVSMEDGEGVHAEAILNAERTSIDFSIYVGEQRVVRVDLEAKEEVEAENKNNYITIQAKYPGGYGNDISIKFSEWGLDYETKDYLYTLVVNYGTESSTYRVSLKYNSPRYIGLIKSNLIDVVLKSNTANTLIPEFVDLALFIPFIKEAKITTSESGITTYEKKLFTDIEGDEIKISDIYKELARTDADSIYNLLSDKTLYNVKFITSGGYNAINSDGLIIARNMLRCAANRTDALAVLDANSNIAVNQLLNNINDNNLYSASITGEDVRNYGTVIAPEAKFNINCTGTSEWMPASFAYFKCLAASQRNNPNWFAIAGTNRGLVPDLIDVREKISGSMADTWQKTDDMNINPIMNVKPVGYCIWGNRTLHKNIDGLTASSFTNVRVLSCDIKKIVTDALNSLTYELNDNVLWNSFRSKVEPYLDQMKTGRGLTDYKLVKQPSTKKATINGLIRIIPIEAVEDFDITFSLEDSLAVVE